MKKIILATVLFSFLTVPAFAFEFEKSKLSVGAGYGLGNNGVLSIRSDYDIAEEAGNPVSVRVGYDRYSTDFGGFGGNYSWSYNIFYAGAYYDFNETLELDEKIHPFAGLGFGFGSTSCSGSYCGFASSPSTGGLYYIGGVQYDLNEQFSAEASYSVWGGISIGVNYKFK